MSDTISRQAALNQIAAIETSIIPYARAREYVDELKNYVIKIIETLPSAEPERTAKVEKVTRVSSVIRTGRCGNCGYDVIDSYKHCPDCGMKLDWSNDE